MLTAVVGVNWGDEGKGRMVDLLSQDYKAVVRYQGGNNAGHTVLNDKGKFILNLLPSGILRDGVTNFMGAGMVIDIEHLSGEIERVRQGGISITPQNLKISDKAVVCMPYHKQQDCMEEDRLKFKKFGSTRRGIAPVYADRYMKKVIHIGDLVYDDNLKERVFDLVEWKNILFSGYGAEPIDAEAIYEWLMKYGEVIKPFVCEVSAELKKLADQKQDILFEAQLGALRDIDFGIYPFTSSSNTLAAYAPIGAGIAGYQLDKSVGIMKAYSTCVGEGYFVAELFGEEADELRQKGGEFGAATGRPRRVGGFDVPASRYGVSLQGAKEIALTKLDVLSGIEKIPVCKAYKYGDKIFTDFPPIPYLGKCEPIVEYLDGWKEDISNCKKLCELPQNAIKYIKYIEDKIGCKIRYISVGANREQYIDRGGEL